MTDYRYMFFIVVSVSTSSILNIFFTLQLCSRFGTRIYVWDKIICVTTLMWFYGFNNLCLFICCTYCCRSCCTAVFWFWLEQIFELARMHISVGQHACSVAQSMYSVEQNRCFIFLGCIHQLASMHVQLHNQCVQLAKIDV